MAADETKQDAAPAEDEATPQDAAQQDAPEGSDAAQSDAAQDEPAEGSAEEVLGDAPEEEGAAQNAEAPDAAPQQVLTLPKTQNEVEEGRTARKERVGTVVSNKMEKTIVVTIERQKKHPMYSKYLTRTSRLMVHDENNDAGEGDTVLVMETRPLSKHKRWRLIDILERAK